jgi:hypothetical protein
MICYFTALGVIATLLGLLYTNSQNNQRQTRAEFRSKVDKLNETLNKLVSASQNYYLDTQSITAKEVANIHHAINSCDRLISEFQEHVKPADLNTEFFALYDSVTGNDFQSDKLQPGQQYSVLCNSISINKEALTKKAETWFKDTFQH